MTLISELYFDDDNDSGYTTNRHLCKNVIVPDIVYNKRQNLFIINSNGRHED